MSYDFSDMIDILEGKEFDEKPVEIEEFVRSERFLNLPPLSEAQYNIIKASTQIYNKRTLYALMGEEAGEKRWKQTCNEVILQLGKGNIAYDQKVYSPEFGYMPAWQLKDKAWLAQSRNGTNAASAFYDEGEDEVFRIHTASGYYIDAGLNHKFPAWKWTSLGDYKTTTQSEPIDIPLAMLRPGDLLEIKANWDEPINPLNISPEDAYFIGYTLDNGEWNDEWMMMSNQCLIQLIKGLFASCGDKMKHLADSPRLVFRPKRMSVTEGIHLSLLRLGIYSTLKGGRSYMNDHIPGYVKIGFYDQISKFAQMVGEVETHPGIMEELAIMRPALLGWVYNHSAQRILWIEPRGKQKTLGTMVELEHNFVAGGIVSCNSGKDFVSTISCAYIVYLLLCLKDPATYFGKPSGDSIDILNIAINAQQANNVFFKGFKTRIEKSPWFATKYEMKAGHVSFDKSINVYSGHSERESFEGYNLIVAILDEISGFALDSNQANDQGKTASAIYNMYKASVASRYPDVGKLISLSFPRFKNDYISQLYDGAVAEKETITKTHKFKLNDELADGADGNEFEITWEEDHIISYKMSRVFALKRATWDVNPTRKIDDFMNAFYTNTGDALGRFACMPSESSDSFFGSREKVEACFVRSNGIDEHGRFYESFVPNPNVKYYLHVDLAKKRDRAAVAIAHVDGWSKTIRGGFSSEVMPNVIIDAVRWWTPTKEKQIDFADIRDFIVSVSQRGFDIGKVTFDRYRSDDMIAYLNSIRIRAEVLSVAKKHYEDFLLLVNDERIIGPYIPILIDELLGLKLMNNDRIDHPHQTGKDLSDASAGAVFNALANTARDMNQEIEVVTMSSFRPNSVSDRGERAINPPPMPKEMHDYLSQLRII